MYEKRIQCSDCDQFAKLPVVLFLFVWFIFKGPGVFDTSLQALICI